MATAPSQRRANLSGAGRSGLLQRRVALAGAASRGVPDMILGVRDVIGGRVVYVVNAEALYLAGF